MNIIYHEIYYSIITVIIIIEPSTGLYFILDNTVYLPGDSILITDVGEEQGALVCMTRNVNSKCCRETDDHQGEWYFPNGTLVPSASNSDTKSNFTRTADTERILLNRRNDATSPIGRYTCGVPDLGGEDIVIAEIFLLGEPTSPPRTTTVPSPPISTSTG